MKQYFSTIFNRPKFHNPVVDGIRGFSILLVVFGHLFHFHDSTFTLREETDFLSSFSEFFRGDLGVDMFFVISGFFSALTGALLLGWSGGGFVGVGDTYLFLTLAAVVVGGTSLLGGWGGYGLSVIGVLVLQLLNSTLIGWGLSYEGQQFILGLLIIPMVALYARSPHIRTMV